MKQTANTPPELSSAFAEFLKSKRELLNQKFQQQSHLAGGIDGGAFHAHLASIVNPIVASVATVMPECAAATAMQLYDLSLTLFASRIIGPNSQHPLITESWQRLLPVIPKLLARETSNVVGMVSNVIHNLGRQPGVKSRNWLDEMLVLAPQFESTKQLMDCAQVLAWRAGMVQFRDQAIETARQLSARLAASALGLPPTTEPQQIDRLLNEVANSRWRTLELAPPTATALKIVGQFCQFRGFGGQFIHPPTVRLQAGSIIVADAESSWQILADAYGSLIDRIGAGFKKPKSTSSQSSIQKTGNGSAQIDQQGIVRWKNLNGSFPQLRPAASWVADDQTLAVTLQDSHHVYLLAVA